MTSIAFIMGVVPLVFSTRRRRRDAPGDGHRGVRRHARRDGVRPVPHAGVLRRRSARLADASRAGRPRGTLPPDAGGRGGPLIDSHALSRSARLRGGRCRWPCCAAARRAVHAPQRCPAALANARCGACRRRSRYDPRWWRQFDDPVLDQLDRPRRSTPTSTSQVAVARVEQARAVFDETSRSTGSRRAGVGAVVDGASRRCPGSATSRSRPTPTAPGSTRSGRSTCSAGCGPRCRRRRRTPRPERGAGRRPGQRGRGGRAQLLRAARPAAAARGAERSLANQRRPCG